MKTRSILSSAFLLSLSVCFALQAQEGTPISPGVGSAVLLAKNSIQVDQGVIVQSGDVIVNDTTNGATYGEKALSLDKNARTPAGFKIAATSIDLDQSAVAGGDAYYNTLVNQGTINGAQFSPLALPVYASLPPMLVRPPGTDDITVAENQTLDLAEGSYGNLVVSRGAIVLFTGGGYAFASIFADRDSQLRFSAPSDIVVSGRISIGRDATVAPSTTSGINAGAIRIQASGINGADGALHSEPSAIDVGNSAHIAANLLAGNGSIEFGTGVDADGAFFAQDILIGRDSHFVIHSNVNAAPTADPQTVTTTGTSPLTITLTGSDPEGSALTFSIVSGPSAGSLSSITQVSPTSANVTYTPNAADVPDSFTFRVLDTGGGSGDAVVTINPHPEDPGTDPTTVIATDSSADTTKDALATLLLRGTAPSGVSLTFSIVSGSGPSHGSLGAVTQGTESPQRTATVDYTPDSGYVGSDAFQFQACGVIGTSTVCDTAVFSINVLEPRPDPEDNLVNNVDVTTFLDEPIDISLGSTTQSFRQILIAPHAAVNLPAAIAGNVADSDTNGSGDNHNPLPGSTPVFMSAGIGQSGSAGSNGTKRMQIEFDISQYNTIANSLLSATVTLPTHRGTTDSVDTSFFNGSADGDGLLSDSDFESAATQISGSTMPVPTSMNVGDDGTFTFNVLSEVQAAMNLGHSFFVVQGRVDESQGGSVRGLEVRTTADGNLPSDVPSLALTTPSVTPLTYRINSLPSHGTLKDSNDVLITSAPYTLPSPMVRYTPNSGFVGSDLFNFQATNGSVIDAAIADIRVRLSRCDIDPLQCDDGR